MFLDEASYLGWKWEKIEKKQTLTNKLILIISKLINIATQNELWAKSWTYIASINSGISHHSDFSQSLGSLEGEVAERIKTFMLNSSLNYHHASSAT